MSQLRLSPTGAVSSSCLDRRVNGDAGLAAHRAAALGAAGVRRAPPAPSSPRAAAVEADQREASTTSRHADVSHPKTADRRPSTFSNWPLYIDKKVLKDVARRTGARSSSTSRTSTTTTSSSRKVRQQLEQGKPIGRDIVVLTDWMAARWVDAGYVEPLDKSNIPNAKNLRRRAAAPGLRPEPRLHAAVAVGHHGHRLQPEEDRAASSRASTTSSTRSSRAGSRCLSEWHDSAGLVLLGMGKDPTTATKDDYTWRRSRRSARPATSGQIRRFTGNDYAKDLAAGNLWACVGLVRRHRPAAGRQPEPRVPRARGGRDDLVGQHDDPGQRARSTRTAPRR